jgi:DNA-binding transcriptional LysR family regulator
MDGEMLLGDARRLLQLEEAARLRLAAPACPARCVSVWSRRSPGARCLRHSVVSPHSIRASSSRCRSALVWAAADTFDLVPGAALPLALYRERSVSREAALAALQDGELTWEIVYTSSNLTGVRAAALAGLAITPLPASAVIAGLRILDAEAGLPRLPDLEFAIYEKARPDKVAAALAAALLALAQGPSRPWMVI